MAGLAGDLGITVVNAILRYAFHGVLLWVDDVSRIALNVITFLGAAAIFRRGGMVAFGYLVAGRSQRLREALEASALWLVALASLLVLWTYPGYFRDALQRSFPVLQANEGVTAIWLGFGLACIALFTVEKLVRLPRRAIAIGALPGIVVAVACVGLQYVYVNGLASFDPLLPAAVIGAAAFLLGVPIAFTIATAALSYMVISQAHQLSSVAATSETGIENLLLVAIPFFLLAGALLQLGGIARRLADLLEAWCGHLPGGLLVTSVVAMYLFSGISGSKTADVAAVGSALKGAYEARGYPRHEAAAVLAASAAMGETVPPSIAMLILGSITTLSIGALFLAGIVPALVLAVGLIVAIVIRARGGRLPRGPRFRLRTALAAVPGATPALLVPVIVLSGILAGVTTPTEASSVAAVYGLVAAAVFYRATGPAEIWQLLREAALTAGMVLFILAAASLLAQAIVLDGLPDTLVSLFTSTGGRLAFLVVSVVGLVVLGAAFEGLPALLIFGPLLIPIAVHFGVNPLQYGILVIMAMGIGVFAPPIGVGLFVTAAIVEAPPHRTFKASAVYTGMLLVGLAIVAAFPEITLAVPHAFKLH